MTFRLGLTGSIGMGKSTTATLFAAEGCAVWDADAAVHRLYDAGGDAVEKIRKIAPEAIVDNAVSRDILRQLIGNDPNLLQHIEQIVHPLVAKDRQEFIEETGADIAVLDIPLLFETDGHKNMDAVVCVYAPPDIQKKRVLDRGTMSENQFNQIIAKQMPDAEKMAMSDYVVITDTVDHAREQVVAIVGRIRQGLENA